MAIKRRSAKPCHAQANDLHDLNGAQSRNRTSDTRIFKIKLIDK